tara:strand:- start:420 stop:1016 length:597 start_codon:yes stop_codon:yes gene_type:complete
MAIYKKVATYSGTEPISLSVAKDFLKVSGSDDDTYITELIEVAREIIEKETNTVLVEHEVTEYRRLFPTVAPYEIQLQFSGVLPDGETVTFKYKNDEASTVTLTQNTDFLVSQYNGVLSLTPMGTNSWPSDLYIETDSISIAYKVEPMGKIPLPLKQAMRLLICHFYDDRSAVAFTKDAVELPLGYRRLISTYKNYFF